MIASHFRVASLLVAASVAVAAPGCGGKTAGGGGEGSSSGSGSGGSSSGGASSGSSGGSSSSGGGSSSSSSSSSSSGGSSSGGGSSGSSSSGGGPPCPAAPGTGACAYAGQDCSYCYEGAGTDCSCGGGQWGCLPTEHPCSLPSCPPGAPPDGTACGSVEYTCGYPTMEGCGGETCTCAGGSWSCGAVSCPPPPACPATPPASQSVCPSVGQTCNYTNPDGCGGATCQCDPSGTWGCMIGDCAADAGAPADGS